LGLYKLLTQTLKSLVFLLALFALSAKADSIGPPDVWDNYEKTLNSLPKDASKTLDIAVNCYHLSGEINGDQSQNDKETMRSMNKLHCDQVEKKVAFIKLKYKNNNRVQEAFKIYYEDSLQ
jgi:hypothetical protein